jgi:hypothetical protein
LKPRAASRGTNQTGVRLYNERLVLSLIRRHGDLPKADIARMTGLSPQTISIITNALEADGLLLRGKPLRGKVGQPLVPYSLNPEGALSFGLKIGRRSVDLYLWSCTEALQFGRRKVRLTVLRLGWSPENSIPGIVDTLFHKREADAKKAAPAESAPAPAPVLTPGSETAR